MPNKYVRKQLLMMIVSRVSDLNLIFQFRNLYQSVFLQNYLVLPVPKIMFHQILNNQSQVNSNKKKKNIMKKTQEDKREYNGKYKTHKINVFGKNQDNKQLDFTQLNKVQNNKYSWFLTNKLIQQQQFKVIANMFSQSSSKHSDRFARVINELNKSTQRKDSFKENSFSALKPSSQISLFGRSSIDSSERSTKITHTLTNAHTISQYHPNTNFQPLDLNEEKAIEILLENYEVMANRVRSTIRAEFVPTSKGLKYILVVSQSNSYVNLSWVHSAQQLQKNKVLILYYAMQKLKQGQKPTIDSLVIQFSQNRQLVSFLSAVLFIHSQYHDQNVQRLYHQLCAGNSGQSSPYN